MFNIICLYKHTYNVKRTKIIIIIDTILDWYLSLHMSMFIRQNNQNSPQCIPYSLMLDHFVIRAFTVSLPSCFVFSVYSCIIYIYSKQDVRPTWNAHMTWRYPAWRNICVFQIYFCKNYIVHKFSFTILILMVYYFRWGYISDSRTWWLGHVGCEVGKGYLPR